MMGGWWWFIITRMAAAVLLHHTQIHPATATATTTATTATKESVRRYNDYYDAAADDDNDDSAYDALVLDPINMFGSPLGGFARDSMHRLAQLPLHLPPITTSTTSTTTTKTNSQGVPSPPISQQASPPPPQPLTPTLEDSSTTTTTTTYYYTVRNAQGRLLACRVYTEDDLEPDSFWTDSFFDAAVLRNNIPEPPQRPSRSRSRSSRSHEHEEGEKEENAEATTTTTATATNHDDDPFPLPSSSSSPPTPPMDDNNNELENNHDNDENDNGEGEEIAEVTSRGVQFRDRRSPAPPSTLPPLPTQPPQAQAVAGDEPHEKETTTSLSGSHYTQLAPPKEQQGGEVEEVDVEEDEDEMTTTAEIVEEILAELEGVCLFKHLGWWSYEWCYKATVEQFHISLEPANDDALSPQQHMHQVRFSDLTRLGTFDKRIIKVNNNNNNNYNKNIQIIDNDDNDNDDDYIILNNHLREKNSFAGNRVEIARVFDVYSDGDLCDNGVDNNPQPRSTLVQMLCCAPEIMAESSYSSSDPSNHADANAVTLYGVHEDPQQLCHYIVTVCTSLLCITTDPVVTETTTTTTTRPVEKYSGTPLSSESESGDRSAAASAAAASAHNDLAAAAAAAATTLEEATRRRQRRPTKDNESIREILDRTLGGRCLESAPGGWWKYSYCHGDKITQFHEFFESKKTRAGKYFTALSMGDEYVLGRYHYPVDTSESMPSDDEWSHVVNATSSSLPRSSRTTRRSSTSGKRTYFHLEYTNGDVCEDAVARASTVRFFCGEAYMIKVSEDNFCHYVVDVTVPHLCKHPLFIEPVMKRQVVKCLPVDDDENTAIL